MTHRVIQTPQAPHPIGCYSQAIQAGNLVFLSGQVALEPQTGALVVETFEAEIHQVFENLKAVAEAAGASLEKVTKFTIYLTDLNLFPQVNEYMMKTLSQPFPARVTIGVSALPKGARIEVDAILVL